MYTSLLLLLLAGSVAAGPWDSQANAKAESVRLSKILKNDASMKAEWKAWKDTFGKAAQGDARYSAWKANMQSIVAQNQKSGQTWWAGPNQYTDLTFDEFSRVALGLDPSKAPAAAKRAAAAAKPARRLLQGAPAAHDWEALGLTTPVKNQANCGSCWAFAAVAAMEAAYKIKYDVTLDMSEQQVTSCDPYDSGCGGGWPPNAMVYAYEKKVTTEANYPYISQNSGTTSTPACDAAKAGLTPRYGPGVASGYTSVAYDSRAALKNAVFNGGPTTIAFMVESAFQSYKGGIFNTACLKNSINHAMVAVGYNETAGYWKIRNSWGATWGESGHIRIAMVNDNPGSGLCNLHYYGGWYPTAVVPPNECSGHCTATCTLGVCGTCDAGWEGTGCNTPICPAGCTSCSDPQTCSACVNSHYAPSSSPPCTACVAGWRGEGCATPICMSSCLDANSCLDPNSCTACKGSPTAHYALPTCTTCQPGYTLSSGCTQSCLTKSSKCSSNGQCCSGKCSGRKCN